MKKTLLIRFFTLSIVFVLIFVLAALAQVPSWQWAKSSANASNNNTSTSVSTALGNVFTTGYFTSSSITFGSTTLNNAGSTNGLPDIFLTKYDASGNVLWAKSAGSGDYDYAFEVANDASGNAYVVGRFQGASITFGTTTLTNTTTGKADLFIAKYDGSGNVVWAKSVGGTKDDGATSVTTDASGNVIVTGWFKSASVTFGATTLTNTSTDTADVFLAKYNSSGTVLWAKKIGGTHNDYSAGVATDGSGNVYIAGDFQSASITFSPLVLTNTASPSNDVYIAKYDGSGNIYWAKKAGGSSYDYAAGVAADAAGNVYFTGSFNGFIAFGGPTLSSAGASDIFLVKYDGTTPSGTYLWSKRAGGTDFDYVNGVALDAAGSAYLTGYYLSGTCTFDTSSVSNPFATSTSDIYVTKYNSSGNAQWAKGAGGSGQDHSNGVCVDASGNGYIAGYYNSPTMVFGTTTLTSSSYQNVFLAKLNGITGIEELQVDEAAVDVYPNPSQGEFVVRSAEFMFDEIEIINVLGEIVFEDKNIHGNSYSVNQKLPQGIYFLRMTVGNNVMTKKIIVND